MIIFFRKKYRNRTETVSVSVCFGSNRKKKNPFRRTPYPGAMEAHPGAIEAYAGAMVAHPRAMEAHPGAMVAHPGAKEVRLGAMDPHSGAFDKQVNSTLFFLAPTDNYCSA